MAIVNRGDQANDFIDIYYLMKHYRMEPSYPHMAPPLTQKKAALPGSLSK
jgi:hypothetical protein